MKVISATEDQEVNLSFGGALSFNFFRKTHAVFRQFRPNQEDTIRMRSQVNMRITSQHVHPTFSVFSDDLLGLGKNIMAERGIIIGFQYDKFM